MSRLARLTLILCIPGALASCGVQKASNHLGSMDQSAERLANEIEADREYLRAMVEQMRLLQESTSKLVAEIRHDRQYLEGLNKHLATVAQSLLELQQMSAEVFEAFMKTFAREKPAPATANLDDFLEPGPAPSGRPQ
jgi:septal ring factor EnvC (AmiA/AmiB activator)